MEIVEVLTMFSGKAFQSLIERMAERDKRVDFGLNSL